MHRDLKVYCAKPSSYDLKTKQRRLNCFVKEYYNIRPYESLDMKTPATIHNFQQDHSLKKHLILIMSKIVRF